MCLWLYRIRPSVKHTGKYIKTEYPFWKTAPNINANSFPLGQYRWDPFPLPKNETGFIDGIRTITTSGDVNTHAGMAASIYAFNKSIDNIVFTNADAEMLFYLKKKAYYFLLRWAKCLLALVKLQSCQEE